MRVLRTLAVVSTLVATVTFVAAPSIALLPACGSIPEGTCYGDQVNALHDADGGGTGAKCTTCLQQKCCDEVGSCNERQATCVREFRTAHQCVLQGGPKEESRCKTNLVDEGGRALYACMRANCGDTEQEQKGCGLTSCQLDTSVILFDNPACDRCLGASCCVEINACNRDRRCKLITNCVLTRCTGQFGEGMLQLQQSSPEELTKFSDGICKPNIAAPPQTFVPPGGYDPTSCVLECLNAFAPDVRDNGTSDDQAARCLAFKMYLCGAKQGCGNQCIHDGGVGDASAEAAPDSSTVSDASKE